MCDAPIGIVGVTGRLGSAVAELCAEVGVTVATVATRSEWTAGPQDPAVIVDASCVEALPDTLDYCRRTRCALVYCASGLTAEDRRELQRLAAEVPVVVAANLSPLHWIQEQNVRTAVALIGSIGIDVESTVIERHPTTKRDAPSATAVVLADGLPASTTTISERYGARVSDHRVVLTCLSETYELSHSVRDLRLAAVGAIALGGRLATAEPGMYTTAELFGSLDSVRES
ncbi:dihydrodipicolinate reductase C-terminal domain-containing protein [Rhodococcus sp. NPDC058514]|uniref:dihydrodipicolinate reductase C-terminal domain-containing protein n=1 Tax=Rhodococcus sp. NPDC058514 TaxID=3346532 RepID=UPI00365ECFE1